jgi:2-dehydropantoate 2-reductase
MQNGVGNEEAIAAHCDPDSIIAGTLTTPVSVLAPGKIQVDRPSYTLGISPWTEHVSMTLVDATHHAFAAAGFSVRTYDRASGLKWSKLLLNMIGNATSAILDQMPADLFADPRIVDLEIAAWREAFAVMRAARITPVDLRGYPLGLLAVSINFLPNAILRPNLRRQTARARGTKPPSLLLDLRSGKTRSEIDYLNGAIVSYGDRFRVATPVNRVLTEIYKRLLAKPEDRSIWRNQTDRLLQAVDAAQEARRRQPMPS